MLSPTVIDIAGNLPRFCAAAGHPLDPNAVSRQAPDLSCVVQGPGHQDVARCSLWWRNTSAYQDHRVGYVGHYAASDPLAAPALLAFACNRLAAEGCTLAVGPVDGNTWQRYRLLTERGSEPPFFLEPDNPDEWPGHWAAAGFSPLAHYCSALNTDLAADGERCERLGRRLAARSVSVAPLRPERFEADLKRVHAMSLLSFRNNFLYSPISEADFLAQYLPIRPYLVPELILLAEKEGELIGFVLGVPDLLQAKRGERVTSFILKTLAVHPDHMGKGLGGLLIARCHQAARAAGFTRGIHALFHEANRSGQISGQTARVFRRYALFARELGGRP